MVWCYVQNVGSQIHLLGFLKRMLYVFTEWQLHFFFWNKKMHSQKHDFYTELFLFLLGPVEKKTFSELKHWSIYVLKFQLFIFKEKWHFCLRYGQTVCQTGKKIQLICKNGFFFLKKKGENKNFWLVLNFKQNSDSAPKRWLRINSAYYLWQSITYTLLAIQDRTDI